MKKIYLFALAAATLFASCSKEQTSGGDGTDLSEAGTAYVSLSIEYPNTTRTRSATTEDGATPGEVNISSVYLLTFDQNQNIVVHDPNGTIGAVFSPSEIAWNVDASGTNTAPVKVSPSTRQILVITSPGPALRAVLDQPYKTSTVTTFAQLNQAITIDFDNQQQQTEVLVNEVRQLLGGKTKHDGDAAYSYFTMINSGWFEDPANPGDPDRQKIDGENICLVPVVRVAVVGDGTNEFKSDAEAIAEAKKYPTIVKIERLASKIEVESKTGILEGNAVGGTLIWPSAGDHWLKSNYYWTLDVVNAKFFPYATKHNSTTMISPTDYYQWPFYTHDPNYRDADIVYPSGLKYNNLAAKTLAPKVTWLGNNFDYCLENTMEASSQLFKYATRIVVRGYFWPANTNDAKTVGDMDVTATAKGDWFRYAGVNYATLTDLQDQYTLIKAATPSVANQAFLDACDHFLKQVVSQSANVAGATKITVTDFADLTQAMLDNGVVNGGELVKHSNGCVRWYQKGVNYWYYEMRHDDGANTNMEQDKYGVVRNNWYQLTMSSVSGHGTPWYPSIIPDEERPDPSDPDDEYDPEEDVDPDPIPDPEDPEDPTPDPDDPLDKDTGYLDFKIKIAPWVKWSKDMPLQ